MSQEKCQELFETALGLKGCSYNVTSSASSSKASSN